MGTRIIHFLFRYIILPIMSFIDWVAGLVTNYPKQFCVFLFAAVLLTDVFVMRYSDKIELIIKKPVKLR